LPRVGGSADTAGIAIYKGVLGSFSWPVTTRVPEAQAYFDQGVRLMYSFAPAEARRSFVEARRRDPQCAMCWWGEAWSMGPYLNGPMEDADAPGAHAAATRARALARVRATPLEKALARRWPSATSPRMAPREGRAWTAPS
jgi:hypothetical protein